VVFESFFISPRAATEGKRRESDVQKVRPPNPGCPGLAAARGKSKRGVGSLEKLETEKRGKGEGGDETSVQAIDPAVTQTTKREI